MLIFCSPNLRLQHQNFQRLVISDAFYIYIFSGKQFFSIILYSLCSLYFFYMPIWYNQVYDLSILFLSIVLASMLYSLINFSTTHDDIMVVMWWCDDCVSTTAYLLHKYVFFQCVNVYFSVLSRCQEWHAHSLLRVVQRSKNESAPDSWARGVNANIL